MTRPHFTPPRLAFMALSLFLASCAPSDGQSGAELQCTVESDDCEERLGAGYTCSEAGICEITPDGGSLSPDAAPLEEDAQVEGSILALYQGGSTIDLLAQGVPFDLTYSVNANFTNIDAPGQSVEFHLDASFDSSFGEVSVSPSSVTLSPPEQSALVTVTVTPSGAATTANLDVIALLPNSNTLRPSSQTPVALELGALPPQGRYYDYQGPLAIDLQSANRIFEVPHTQLTRASGRSVLFTLVNDTNEERTYVVQGQIIPDVQDASGWGPLELGEIADSPHTVPANSDFDILFPIHGPMDAEVGTTGVVVSTVTSNLGTASVSVPFSIVELPAAP